MISRSEKNTQRLAALDAQASALKLKPGMGIADARAMYPAIEVIEEDAAADRRLLESIADWCDRYTPLVAIEGRDGLFLDITGCSHLFGGEEAMLLDAINRLDALGIAARAGIASTPGAAWAASRFAREAILAPGREGEFITDLPLAALRLPPDTIVGLESVGLRTAGAILTRPRAPLVRRFGREVTLRLDQATGAIEEAISPRLPVPALSIERHLVEPVDALEAVEQILLGLAKILKRSLEQRGQGARQLVLLLFRVDGLVSRVDVGTSRPLREPRLIQKLFHERLGVLSAGIDIGYGFELIRLNVVSVDRLQPEQVDLAKHDRDAEGDAASFADQVRARLGERAVSVALPRQSHLPERAVEIMPFGETAIHQETPAGFRLPDRPIRLFERPESLSVRAVEVPEGPPLLFEWRRTVVRTRRVEGPERIAPEWWREPAGTPTRDYFRVEDEEGRRYWIFRQGLFGASLTEPRWFMHGIFA